MDPYSIEMRENWVCCFSSSLFRSHFHIWNMRVSFVCVCVYAIDSWCLARTCLLGSPMTPSRQTMQSICTRSSYITFSFIFMNHVNHISRFITCKTILHTCENVLVPRDTNHYTGSTVWRLPLVRLNRCVFFSWFLTRFRRTYNVLHSIDSRVWFNISRFWFHHWNG